MVTGDNIHTAKHIAKECCILHEGGLAMEGPDFRAKSEEELIQLLPQLQVLARSSPADKLVLVRTLKKMGDIVAVTGDGTNDAPALKESDVGMAMGIAGTEVSKVRRKRKEEFRVFSRERERERERGREQTKKKKKISPFFSPNFFNFPQISLRPTGGRRHRHHGRQLLVDREGGHVGPLRLLQHPQVLAGERL